MDLLKKVFPYAFAEKKDVAALIINVIVFLVIGLVVGVVMGLLKNIPVLGLIINLVGGLFDIYVLATIVLSILDYLKILK